jgi:hypothetical protein
MKLFQIEEPDGTPSDAEAPGAAVGIDASGISAEVAVSVGGNALVLEDREGFEQTLAVPTAAAGVAAWQELLEGARMRAERALARPVTDTVIVLAVGSDGRAAETIKAAAARAGLSVLRLLARDKLAMGSSPALAAAMIAEDLALRPEPDPPGPA